MQSVFDRSSTQKSTSDGYTVCRGQESKDVLGVHQEQSR